VPVRRSSIVLATVGVVLIVLGVLVRFVVVPVATKLPGSTNLSVTYSGKSTLLNSSALQSGDTKNVIATNVPTTVDRQLKVTSIQGDTAIVSDDLTIHAGSQTLPSNHTYALNRSTLEGVTPPAGVSVEPSVGALSSMFPIGPAANSSYRYYDSTTRGFVPISYTGHATRDGRSVNLYTISSAGAVKDPGLLKMLPPSLPKKLIAGLAPLLPAAERAKFTPAVLSALPNPIPLSYTGTTSIAAVWTPTHPAEVTTYPGWRVILYRTVRTPTPRAASSAAAASLARARSRAPWTAAGGDACRLQHGPAAAGDDEALHALDLQPDHDALLGDDRGVKLVVGLRAAEGGMDLAEFFGGRIALFGGDVRQGRGAFGDRPFLVPGWYHDADPRAAPLLKLQQLLERPILPA
jgi:hypothetical protein